MSKETLARLVVKLEAQSAQYKKELGRAEARLSKYKSRTKKDLSGIKSAFVATFAALGVGAFVKKVASASMKQEAALKQLQQSWNSTGGAVGLSVDEMVKDAQRLQGITIFGDEEIIKAQSKLTTFTNITGENFKATTEAVLNLSTKMDQNLNSSVVQLGKVLNSPVENLGALSRSGIQFSDKQKVLIKTFTETNQLGKAQKVILAELERQFGGSAIAARDTFGGALKGLDNAFGDLFEANSMAGAKDGIEELTALLSSPETIAAAGSLTNAIINGFSNAAKAVTKTVNAMRFLGEELAARIHGPAIGDIVRINDLLADKKARLEELNAIEANRSGTGGRTGDSNRAEIAALEAEIADLQVRLDLSSTAKTPDLLNTSQLGGDGGGLNPANQISQMGDEYGFKEDEDPFAVPESTVDLTKERLTEVGQVMKSWRDQEAKNEAQFQAKILQFQRASTKDKVKTVLAEGVALTQGAAHTSKKLFKLNKALALADAAVTLPSAVLKAVERGGGLPWGAAFGAMTLAAGLARIRSIKNAKFGGGSAASLSGVGGGSTITTQATAPPIDQLENLTENKNRQAETQATYQFLGDVYGFEDFEDKLLDVIDRSSSTNRVRVIDQNGRLVIRKT